MVLRYGKESEDCIKRKIIGKPKTINEAYAMIRKYLKEIKYKSYYYNTTVFFDHLRIDYGDYTKFFYLEDLSPNWKTEWDEYCSIDRTNNS